MRRKEFEVHDRVLMEEVLKTADIGYLAFNSPDGWPRITPLTFVYDGRVLWHGAIAGERFDCLKANPQATFSAVSIHQFLPSHLTSEEDGTFATIAFKSVQVQGFCQLIDDPEEKCGILNRIMEKYQPEGRYRKISPQDPIYCKALSAVGVYALTAKQAVGKFKFAQKRSKTERLKIAAKLKERGAPADLIIAEEILKVLD